MAARIGADLDKVRGSLDPARANARSVAALTDNPGCTRRRVIDAAAVKTFELAEKLGHPVTRGQSPFAISSGNSFERRLKEGSNYQLLAEVLAPFVELPESGFRVADLGSAPGLPIGPAWLAKRASMTNDALAKIARGDADAPHLVDHPVLQFDVAGTFVNLEPDALALRSKSGLQLVEIKSYPIIDSQADGAKVSATAGQSAVYLLAIRAALTRLGFDPDILDWSVILVAAKNFGRMPTAHYVPLRKKANALLRVLGAVPRTDGLLHHLPADFTLDVDPSGAMPPDNRRQALDLAVQMLPMLFVPECLSSCDLARYCRHRAVEDDDPARLGRVARDSLAGVPALKDALRLAGGGLKPEEAEIADVAEALATARDALTRARARAPVDCGVADDEHLGSAP